MLVRIFQCLDFIGYFLIGMIAEKGGQNLCFDRFFISNTYLDLLFVMDFPYSTQMGICAFAGLVASGTFQGKTTVAIIANMASPRRIQRIPQLLRMVLGDIGGQLL